MGATYCEGGGMAAGLNILTGAGGVAAGGVGWAGGGWYIVGWYIEAG